MYITERKNIVQITVLRTLNRKYFILNTWEA